MDLPDSGDVYLLPMDSGTTGSEVLDRLTEEFVSRCRRGDAPSAEEYAAAHPSLATEILDLFPTLLLVERGAALVQDSHERLTFPGLEVLQELAPGVGGMGRVFRAREATLDRIVAVKTTRAHMRTDEGRAYFVREARAAAGLDHPNILKVFSFDPDHAPPYYVMQYVEGRPLDEACRGRDARYVAEVVEKIARGLEYAHRRGIAHRDVKPGNVLVDSAGEPHITDFGLAKPMHGEVTGDVGVSSVKGTPRYIAPEVYEGAPDAGPSVDVYALGVTLYELLCDVSPFAGDDVATVRAAVLRGEPALPQEVAPDVPEPLQRICLKAMAREASARYAGAGEMADDLRRFLQGRAVRAQPQRYRSELRGRMQNHLAEIHMWRDAKLIGQSTFDRLVRPYRLLLQDDSPWEALSRRFPWEAVLLRVGGLVVLVSSILWPAFDAYWHLLSSWERVYVVGAPTLILNMVGWAFERRGSRLNAVIFLSTGVLLLPLLVGIVLTEYELFSFSRGREYELFSNEAFAPTNFEILLSMLSMLAYAAYALVRTRARVFTVWVGAATYFAFTGALLFAGLKKWIDDKDSALAVLLYVPLSLAFIGIARRLRERADGKWSGVFYLFFPVPFVLTMTLFAKVAGDEWYHADFHEQGVQMLLMFNGPLYLAAALLSARGWATCVRFWAPFFLALVPVSFITPANVLFAKGKGLFLLGEKPFTAYELIAVLVSLVFVAVGTRFRRVTLIVPGLLGFGVFLFRATDRHFEGTLAWPLSLLLAGTGAMLIGVTAAFWRTRSLSE